LTCGARAAQIKDAATAIPRNSLIEANQSGLIAEPLVDITPQLPIPQYRVRLFCSTPWTAARCTFIDIASTTSIRMCRVLVAYVHMVHVLLELHA
jgi:hypothetical protein